MSAYETRVTPDKVAAVDALKEMFGGATDYVFTDYRGLTVKQITELRSKLREADADYRVIKNTFARLALSQLDKPTVDELLTGPTAVALSRTDSAPVVKILLEYAKSTSVEVKGAIVGDQVFNSDQTEAYSKLPSREALISQLMSVMQAPLQNFVYALNGVPTKLVRVMQAVAEKKGE